MAGNVSLMSRSSTGDCWRPGSGQSRSARRSGSDARPDTDGGRGQIAETGRMGRFLSRLERQRMAYDEIGIVWTEPTSVGRYTRS